MTALTSETKSMNPDNTGVTPPATNCKVDKSKMQEKRKFRPLGWDSLPYSRHEGSVKMLTFEHRDGYQRKMFSR